jgi:hypothetical protein
LTGRVTTLPPTQLEYAPAPASTRRPALRRATVAAAIVLVAVASLKWAGPAWDRVRLVYYQGRCLKHQAPTGGVVHDDAVGGRSVGTALEWERFYTLFSPPGGRHGATAFLHELRQKDGSRRLVSVESHLLDIAHPATGALAFSHLSWAVVEPGGLWSPPRLHGYSTWNLPLSPLSQAPLRLSSGQPDPNDPSHFTIPYELGGAPGIIDGWLRADDTLLFEPRDAAVVSR